MQQTICATITALLFLSNLVFAGNHVRAKAPHRVADANPVRVIGNDGPLPPMVSALGPGDSIGYTYYDYSTNGSARRVLVNHGDGALSFATMASDDGGVTGWANRGSWYKYFDGTSWSADWSRIESLRRGWTSIAHFVDAGGTEAVLSHTGLEVNVNAARGTNVWSSTIAGGTGQLWPRFAIGSGFTVHIIYLDSNPPSSMLYGYSTDAGATWDMDNSISLPPGALVDADAYNITASGTKVAYVVAGAGGDVVVGESLDGGATWTQTLIYDIDESGFTAGDEPSDGACDILYDSNGNLHVAWGCDLYTGDGSLYWSQDSGIRHWSAATGVQEIAWADPNPDIIHHGLVDGNFITHPDLAADADGNVFVTYFRFINEQDAAGNFYQHVFATGSADGGASWSSEYELTPGEGFDAPWPGVADFVDEYLHFVYYCDPLAANALQGGHGDIQVAFMYHKVDKTALLTGAPGIPCEDFTNLAARCLSDTIQVRVVLRGNTSHAGEVVTFKVDDDLYTAAIYTNGVSSRAEISATGYEAGDHSIEIVDCYRPRTLSCGSSSGDNLEWGEEEALWNSEANPETETVPIATTLIGSYPNPFNPSTTISYALEQDAWVTLKVFSVLGEEVVTLVDGLEESGLKSVTFDAAGIPSGTYFYRLEAGNVVQTKKLILMK